MRPYPHLALEPLLFNALVLAACLVAGSALAQTSFPQHEKHSCPSYFTTSGGMCKANNAEWVGMVNPNGMASCPSGWTRSTYYCIKKVAADKPSKAAGSKPAGGTVSESNQPTDVNLTVNGKPVVKRVAKRDEVDYCPSGYHTSHVQRSLCVTIWAEAPDVSVKQGACPAGTTEEQGQFCTAASSLSLARMDAAYVTDFNGIYMARKQKGLDTSDANRPVLFAQASDASKAAAAPATTVTAQAAPGAEEVASPAMGQDTKAKVKALGGAIKGLFSR